MRTQESRTKYPEKLISEIVHLYYTGNKSISFLEREFKVSRSSIKRWVKKGKINYVVENDIKRDISTFASGLIKLPICHKRN
ncbi:MAG: hypothetical protein R3Y26_11155 [Rikenellaceae bacterium]